mmetsp:Transcript_6870/g.6391  ORF Transcript_6870/g.6391 Transcript_6870/m.6391 type:complete len:242 (+) Transcript_6870:840-1565(+)
MSTKKRKPRLLDKNRNKNRKVWQNKDRREEINKKVNNIYSLIKEEEKGTNEDISSKPGNFAEKPLQNKLNWMKPTDQSLESSKENNNLQEESKEEVLKSKAKLKIDKYRKSIIKMLDDDSEENQSFHDGLETNREVSDEERDDDNIMENSQKSLSKKPVEFEKDLTLESISDPVLIEGPPYFQKPEECIPDPVSTLLKGVILERFGNEYKVSKGIEFVKKQGNNIFLENKRQRLVTEFKQT